MIFMGGRRAARPLPRESYHRRSGGGRGSKEAKKVNAAEEVKNETQETVKGESQAEEVC
jgi:hypothetical protein